jgi:hypothetical protein
MFQALAVGYSSGNVYIIDIEDKEVLDKYELVHSAPNEFDAMKNFGISCITWCVRSGTLESAKEYNIYVSQMRTKRVGHDHWQILDLWSAIKSKM